MEQLHINDNQLDISNTNSANNIVNNNIWFKHKSEKESKLNRKVD